MKRKESEEWWTPTRSFVSIMICIWPSALFATSHDTYTTHTHNISVFLSVFLNLPHFPFCFCFFFLSLNAGLIDFLFVYQNRFPFFVVYSRLLTDNLNVWQSLLFSLVPRPSLETKTKKNLVNWRVKKWISRLPHSAGKIICVNKIFFSLRSSSSLYMLRKKNTCFCVVFGKLNSLQKKKKEKFVSPLLIWPHAASYRFKVSLFFLLLLPPSPLHTCFLLCLFLSVWIPTIQDSVLKRQSPFFSRRRSRFLLDFFFLSLCI